MGVINHGNWKLYTPKEGHPHAPPNTLYARNDRGEDWYNYIKDKFQEGSVKMMCSFQRDMWIVGPAVYDADRLFPAGQMVLEITDYEGDDPGNFIGKSYNPDSNEFRVIEDGGN